MTKFLISFPSAAMQVPADAMQAVVDASHAVVRDAKAAGVWVFGGGIDERVPPIVVAPDGTVSDGAVSEGADGAPPQPRQLDGGWSVLELPSQEDAIGWAARIAAACRCPQEVRQFGDDPES